MKHFVTLLILLLCSAAAADAQTYIDNLKQKKQGQGTVTVHQSKEIDDLVNGSNNTNTRQEEYTTKKTTVVTPPSNNKTKTSLTPSKTQDTDTSKRENNNTDGNLLTKKPSNDNIGNEGTDIPAVDMRKKVMRQSYKVPGYRVQAFAGGNSRADRQKAENIGNTIKMKFPGQPVYVHFYSPRWICRIGNFRTYDEANMMLQQIKKMGYDSAIIVKGKITVQY